MTRRRRYHKVITKPGSETHAHLLRKEKPASLNSAVDVLNSTIKNSSELLERHGSFFPVIFLALVFIAFLIVRAPASVLLPLIFFFLPAFFFFRYAMGQGDVVSTVFAIPFSLAFNSIIFRLSLLFSASAEIGWISLIFGWLVIFVLGFIVRRFVETDSMKILSEEKTGAFAFYFLIVTFFAVLAYSLIFGAFTPDKVFWGSADSNWQISLLRYLDNGRFEMPSYLCNGLQGYDLDSFTSTTSVIGPYMVRVLGGFSPSLGQEIFLFIGFMLMMQAIFLLLSKLFGLNNALLSSVFMMLPLSIFPYLTEFLGIWRVSLFNAFFPWALLMGFFWLDGVCGFFIRTVLLTFLVPIQPFSALLLIPGYVISFFRGFNTTRLVSYIIMSILVLTFFYFTFMQVTFNTIGAGGAGYSFGFGLDEISRVDSSLSLVPHLQISFANLGIFVVLLWVLSVASVFYLLLQNRSPFESNLLPLAATLGLGLLFSSGIVNISDNFIQYILKMRYTVLIVLAFPLSYILALKLFRFRKILGAFVIFALLLIGFGNLDVLKKFHVSGGDMRTGVHSWMGANAEANSTIMYPESVFSQSAVQQLQMRHMPFPANVSTTADLVPSMLYQKEIVSCSFKRYGLFDVRNEPPENPPKTPDYMISLISNQHINTFFENNSFKKIYSDQIFVVYEKKDS